MIDTAPRPVALQALWPAQASIVPARSDGGNSRMRPFCKSKVWFDRFLDGCPGPWTFRSAGELLPAVAGPGRPASGRVFLSPAVTADELAVEGHGYDQAPRLARAGGMVGLEGRVQVTSIGIPELLRHGARAVAAGRVALGLTALVWPSVPARPWVGGAADELGARVFGRALGARDLALGLGALAALQGPATEAGAASAWVAAGALSDALDVVASVSSWRELPRTGRWLVVASAGGAALAGAAGAVAVRPGRNSPPT
jgi:hypothetical protein